MSRSSRPRLLLLSPVFPPAIGGVELVSAELARGLAESWDVTAIAPASRAGPAAPELEPGRTRAAWGGLSSGAVLAEMALRGRRTRPDVVLAAHLFVVPAARAAARGRPVAVILHGGELRAATARRLVRLFAAGVTQFFAVSEFTRGAAVGLGIPGGAIAVEPPGARLPPQPSDSVARLGALGLVDDAGEIVPFVLTVARLADAHKGHDAVIRALPQVLERCPTARYVAAGSGPLLGRLAGLAREVGVGERVVFPGRVDEATKASLLRNCRAYVGSLREAEKFEGFGIAVVEAALAGRPAVGGAAGAVPEVVRDGETGIVVEPGSEAALVDALGRLLGDRAYADALGERARSRAEGELTWNRAVERYDRGLRRLLR